MSTVLLVDDDPDNLWALQLALENAGHHVLIAQNGAQALRIVLHEMPVVIVTDWQMPEMDGAELCRRVRCQPAFAHLPIVMLSAMAEPGFAPRCWSAFFQKPADLQKLLQTVNAFVAARLTTSIMSPGFAGRTPPRWRPVNERCWP
jgi:CheY-like chemotaxis protein